MDPLKWLINQASQNKNIQELVLFGSRARGDHTERSDFDVAIKGDFTNETWAKWALETQEQFPSLCGLDLVRITNDIASDFINKIESEGRVLFSKSI